MQKTRELWNLSVQSVPTDKSHSRYAAEKEKLFPRESVICDLAGSIGADAIYFLKHKHKVILCDVSDVALKIAQQKALSQGFDLQTQQFDLEEGKIPLADNSVDIVYARLGLHYFTIEKTSQILHEVYRILKLGGQAFITIKSPDDQSEMAFLRKTAKEIEPNVYVDGGQCKSRFNIEQ